ncbi:thiamine phosphate synthase [Snuella lapsa]|uniref:Thiamine phosphate synthase n=1 Tax=Snuella lapsa TaxID=870481 RepID=A0ABP6XJW6_9FLAO
MLIVVAPEISVPNEIAVLNRLFKVGLTCYHLRKPELDFEGHCRYISQIDTAYHKRIMVHRFHELTKHFNLKGIHFQEEKRRDLGADIDNYIESYNGCIEATSSSFHTLDALNSCETAFNYHFLSPVFTSISKKEYKGKGFNVMQCNKKVIGMGGVTQDNLYTLQELGYQGAAVLGSIWNSNVPVDSFKILQNAYKAYVG